MKIRRAIYMVIVFTIVNVFIYINIYNLLEAKGKSNIDHALKQFFEAYDNSEHPCPTEYDNGEVARSESVKDMTKYNNKQFQCHLNDEQMWKARVNITIEKEMDNIKISYPKYLLQVSGYLQLIQLKRWNVKRLKVIIMPHSHQDPGWKSTFQSYFLLYGKATLNNLINILTTNLQAKFIWSEISILSEWWSHANQGQKDKLKRLVHRGQLEITTGGWVMTDEGTAHYTAMLDQLIEGHQWIKHNIGIEANTSWSVDPFGHSPTMAYLLKQSNIQSMVIQRVHYTLKQHLAKKKNFDFYWRQGWASDESLDILCHMMPYLSYAIQYSCGPDPKICCQYDFYQKQCYFGSKKISPEPVNNSNLDRLARQLWEQFQQKAELYRTGVVLVPHGDDFRYANPLEWSAQMNNLDKLIRYINSRPYFQTQVNFGTLSDYFNEVAKTNTQFPTLSGDFFTYSDRGEDYWSGYYTSRPQYKLMIRRMQDLLRSLELLFSYSLAAAINKKKQTVVDFLLTAVDDLSYMRQQVALFQHHDAITGTSAHKVMVDYGNRLHSGYKRSVVLLEKLVSYTIHDYKKESSTAGYETVFLSSNWTNPTSFIEQKVIDINKTKQLLLYNSLSSDRQSVIKLHINSPYVKIVSMATNAGIKHQVSPVIENDFVQENRYELSFRAVLKGLSISRYLLSPSRGMDSLHSVSKVQILVNQNEDLRFGKFKTEIYRFPMFMISNEQLTATFKRCNGKLQYITRHNSTRHKAEVQLMTYGTTSWANPFKDKSGAYLFLPDGNAKTLQDPIKYMYIVKGDIYSSVIVKQSSVSQIYTLYNLLGSEGMGMYIETIVNMSDGSVWDNKELVMRIITDIKHTDHKLCVDMNGFQMHWKKTRKNLPVQGNFYPMTSMAFVENDVDRMTLLSSETHGVASLSPGWMEVVLDRRLIQDDWRGLSEGITDNVPTRSQFVLLFESRNTSHKKKRDLMCYPSPTAAVVSRQLESSVISLTSDHISGSDLSHVKLSSATYWDINILNIRYLSLRDKCMQTLLVVHVTGLDCSFPIIEYDWNLQSSENGIQIADIFKDNNNITSVEQTTLTGTRSIRNLSPYSLIKVNAMEITSFKLTVC